jgi:hypothetical protein
MKKIFTLCFFFTSINLFAQPTVLSSEMAPFGSSFYYKHLASFSVVDTNLQGANQTWDFSQLTTTADPDFTVTIFDPSQSSQGSVFPTANYGTIEGPSLNYNFFVLTQSQLERVGGWNATDGYSIYSDGQIEMMFPFSYGQTIQDSSYIQGNALTNFYQCDNIGYGTVIVPGHTYTNVIMSRVYLYYGLDLQEYLWYNSDNGQPVFVYVAGDGFIVPEAGVYLYNSSITGIDENNFANNISYNNPVTGILNVTFACATAVATDFELFNSTGEKILQGKLEKSSLQHFSIDMENYSGGLYILNLINADDKSQRRSLKIARN